MSTSSSIFSNWFQDHGCVCIQEKSSWQRPALSNSQIISCYDTPWLCGHHHTICSHHTNLSWGEKDLSIYLYLFHAILFNIILLVYTTTLQISLNFCLTWCLHIWNKKNRHSKGLFVSEGVAIQAHSTTWLTFRKTSVVQIWHFLWGNHEALGLLSVYKIGCNFGPERSFSFKLAPLWTAAFELANHVLNMGFRLLVCGSAQVYIPHTQKSQTGSSLPVDLYLRVGDFLSKLSWYAFYAGETPVIYAQGTVHVTMRRGDMFKKVMAHLLRDSRLAAKQDLLCDSVSPISVYF